MLKNLRLNDINPNIVCTLCNGYFIDPVTLVECLHSFCKTCIVKYVATNKVCPICLVQIHKTRPLLSMKSDKILQNIVFKLVPNLYIDEMNRRKKFQELHEPTKVSREELEKHFFFRDDKISMSIEYYDSNNQSESNPDKNLQNRRYLECPGTVKVQHLKKFIIMKYGLGNIFVIDIIYMGDIIPEDYTLIDVAYYYKWKKDTPMRFFYRIFKKTRIYLKRKRPRAESESTKTDQDTEPSTKQLKENLEETQSSKKDADDKIGIKTLKATKENDKKLPRSPSPEKALKPDQKTPKSGSTATSEAKKTDNGESEPKSSKERNDGYIDSIGQRNNLSNTPSNAPNLKTETKDIPLKSPNNSGAGCRESGSNSNNDSRFEKQPSSSKSSPVDGKSKQNKSNSSGGQILSVVNNLAKKQLDLAASIDKDEEELNQYPIRGHSNSPPPMAIFSAALQLQYAVKPSPVTSACCSPTNGTPVMVSPTQKSSSPKSLLSNVTVLSPTEKSKQTLNELRQFRKTSSSSSPTKSSSSATQLNLSGTSKSLQSNLITRLFENTSPSSQKLVANASSSDRSSDLRPPGSLPTPKSPVSDEKKVKPTSPTSSGSSVSNKQHAQLPSNRLQLKVQQSSAVSPFQSQFQSTIYNQLAAEALWKHQQAATVAAVQAKMQALATTGSLSKSLNQGVRQIPNPSLLAKQQQDLIMAMAAAAVIRSGGDPHQNTER